MEQFEQRQIANEILDGLRNSVREALDNGKVPEEWDGIEIRQWIADLAQEKYAYNMDRKRARAYRNVRGVTAGL